jgi:hypothetical protein
VEGRCHLATGPFLLTLVVLPRSGALAAITHAAADQ